MSSDHKILISYSIGIYWKNWAKLLEVLWSPGEHWTCMLQHFLLRSTVTNSDTVGIVINLAI